MNLAKKIKNFESRGGLISTKASAYQAASTTDRTLSRWYPAAGSADTDILPELDILRPRSRDLIRNHGIAKGAVETTLDSVVGSGLRLSASPNYRILGKSKEWARDWAKNVESLWNSWADSIECDVEGELTFSGLTRLMFSSSFDSGESLALPYWLPKRKQKYRTFLGVIEADRLSNPGNQPDSTYLRGGIELTKNGRRKAYHILKNHPGDSMCLDGISADEWQRVPARTSWGRQRVIHLYDKKRPGQKRGVPILSSVIPQFRMMGHYQKTELQAAIVNAMIAAFIETPLESESLLELFGGDLARRNANRQNVPLRGGAIIPLQPGEKLSTFAPNRPAGSYAPFIDAIVSQIAPGLNMSPELLLKDFRRSNYSSARAMLVEVWRHFFVRRAWLKDFWCQPVYALWLEDAISLGEIEAPDFYEPGKKQAYCRASWIGPGRGWIDPVKEAQAARLRIEGENPLSTLKAECAEQGLDWEEVMEQRAFEREKARQAGLAPLPVESWTTGNNQTEKGENEQE